MQDQKTAVRKSACLIAIVDDDTSVRDAVSSIIRAAGFRTMTFDSAQAFLDADMLNAESCLILDVQMPDCSGLELQRRLMTAQTATPIIFMSARTTGEARALRNGAIAFLRKPFTADELLHAVHQALK